MSWVLRVGTIRLQEAGELGPRHARKHSDKRPLGVLWAILGVSISRQD
jgi:hypothetical protein